MAVRSNKTAASTLADKGYSPRAVELGSATPAEVLPANIGEAIAQERLRILAILDSEAAATHPALAKRLALHSHMGADEALAMLAAVPPEAPAAVDQSRIASAFIGAMEATAAQLNVAPSLGGMPLNKKEARRAELEATGRAFGESKGFRRPSEKA